MSDEKELTTEEKEAKKKNRFKNIGMVVGGMIIGAGTALIAKKFMGKSKQNSETIDSM